MPVDMFMEMGKKIEGETQDKEFSKKNAIDVLDWSWGMSQSGTFHQGGGGGSGKASFQALSFTKWVDSSTPALMIALAKGSQIPECKLTVRKAGEGQQKYIEMTMKRCLVSSVTTGAGGADRVTENVTLKFGEVTYEYFTQDERGATKSAGDFRWNIDRYSGPRSSLTIFFLGTNHTKTKSGLLQEAYRQVAAAATEVTSFMASTISVPDKDYVCIFSGPGGDVSTSYDKIKNKWKRLALEVFVAPGKELLKLGGGIIAGVGWEKNVSDALDLTDSFMATVGTAKKARITVIGHSRGSISCMRYLDEVATKYEAYGNLQINAYLNDPVGGPLCGDTSQVTKIKKSPRLRCLRAVQMMVVKIGGRVKRVDRLAYAKRVPLLKDSGFREATDLLIGETGTTAGESIEQERRVVFMPGTHGQAVESPSKGTPQSKIGACLLESFLRHVGVPLSKSLVPTADGSDHTEICLKNYTEVQSKDVYGLATKRGFFKKQVKVSHAFRQNRARLLTKYAEEMINNNFIVNFHNAALLYEVNRGLYHDLVDLDEDYKKNGRGVLTDDRIDAIDNTYGHQDLVKAFKKKTEWAHEIVGKKVGEAAKKVRKLFSRK